MSLNSHVSLTQWTFLSCVSLSLCTCFRVFDSWNHKEVWSIFKERHEKVNITNLYIHLVPVLQELCNVNNFFSLLEIPVYFLVIQGKKHRRRDKRKKKSPICSMENRVQHVHGYRTGKTRSNTTKTNRACLPWTAIRIMNKPLIMFAHQNTALFGIDLRVDPLDVLIALPKYLW